MNTIFDVPLVEKIKIADRTWELTYKVDDQEFFFCAGQYIWLISPSDTFIPPTFFHLAKYPKPQSATPPIPRLLSVAAVTSHAPASARHVVFQVR